jgi:hypothetical protein
MSMILKNTVFNILKTDVLVAFKAIMTLLLISYMYNSIAIIGLPNVFIWSIHLPYGLQLHGTYGHVKLLCFGKVSVLYLELD